MKSALEESMKKQRGNAPSKLEMIVLIYVLGFIWEETREIYREGIRNYLRNLWNFIDFTRNSIYCFTFLLRAIAFFQQMSEINKDPSTAYIPRENWDAFDPHLIVNISLKHFSKPRWQHLVMIDFHFLLLPFFLSSKIVSNTYLGRGFVRGGQYFFITQTCPFVLN